MYKKIKLIWDFRGPAAERTAEHHSVHLKEYANKEDLHFYDANFSKVSEYYSIAFIVINEKDMLTFRDALKPHRGKVVK